jgi:hypothetical protein
LYVVCVWPVPQSTSTAHGASLRPGSLNPKSSVTALPARHAVPVFPPRASAPTDGATLLTVTVLVAVLPAAPSESVACAVTSDVVVAAAGFSPSGNLQSKLPPAFVPAGLETVPSAPQLIAGVWSSLPGSVIVYV